MSAGVRKNPTGRLEVDKPVRLFHTHIGDAVLGQDGPQYAVSSDGQRFLINTIVEEMVVPISVIVNWQARQ